MNYISSTIYHIYIMSLSIAILVLKSLNAFDEMIEYIDILMGI